MGGGDDFGGQLAKDQDNQSEDDGSDEAGYLGMLFGDIGGDEIGDEAGGGNFGDRDAEQDDSEQAIGIGDNFLDCLGFFVSRFRLVFEPEAVDGHKGGLGGRKKHREGQEESEKNDIKQQRRQG